MSPHELFRAGRLDEAIQSLSAELRDRPTDSQRRTFLFELLCFAGEFGRAFKHLDILSKPGTAAGNGVLLYRSALTAERKRNLFFDQKAWNEGGVCPDSPSGTVNGRRFLTIRDADPRIGARLEIFVAGEYLQIPFSHLSDLTVEQPKYLRDLLWATGRAIAGPALHGKEMGELLLPTTTPGAFRQKDDNVRLGRITYWETLDDLKVPAGQKLLIVEGENGEEDELPILEIRALKFDKTAPIA